MGTQTNVRSKMRICWYQVVDSYVI